MWKKVGLFFFFFSISLFFLANYHITKAKKLQRLFESTAASHEWLIPYLDTVETLHIRTADKGFQKVVSDWSEKASFLDALLDKAQLSDGLSSLESHLYTLSLDYHLIHPSVARYPANRWIYRYINDVDTVSSEDIPGLVIHAMYSLSQGLHEYSIERLSELIDYRNAVVLACESNAFKDWKIIKGKTTCSHVKATLMENHWKTWFDYSAHKRDYLPRLIGKYARLSTLKYASLEVCNFAPYKAQSILQHATENGLVQVNGWYHFDIGECKTFNKKFIDTEPELWVHMQNSNLAKFNRVTNQLNEMLASDTNSQNDHLVLIKSNASQNLWIDSVQCIPRGAFSFDSVAEFQGICDEKVTSKVSFARAKQSIQEPTKWFFYAEHPNLVTFRPDADIDDASAREEASNRAKVLSQVIDRQERFENLWTENQIPFSLGASPYDVNGSLSQGVMLQNVASLSIGGASMPYQNGDMLVLLNDVPIYGISDLYGELIKHGFSLSAGYKKPLKVGIERNGEVKIYKSSYFFNENHPSFYDVTKAEATAWGIGDAVTFGASEATECAGKNILALGGNTLSGFIELGFSFIDDRKFDKRSLKRFDYVDFDKCTWESEQRKAIAQQRYQDLYIDSQWFALVTPSAVRLAGQRAFRKYTRKNIAKGTLGVAISDGMLEGIETGIWTLGTSAPELTLEARMKNVSEMAPYGAGLGFISGLVFRNAVKGGK
ncbi:hypothetical protein [Alkalimarinus coralli]|uniref:hypothetical protein n=1 Tax=Alkalimarinus coralli TaxID=2935863 RepID=UPI00202B1B7F|nr:hypothetical protein [Alkalimarinus coralli]